MSDSSWTFASSSMSARRVGDPVSTTACLLDNGRAMSCSIAISPSRTLVSVTFSHARPNYAIAEAARLYAMILDTLEDFNVSADRDPREHRLAIKPPTLTGRVVTVHGADALVALYGFFGDVIEEIL